MKEADIRKYAGLMEELGLTGLEITEDNQVVRLERILQSAPTMPMPCPQPIPQKDPASGERTEKEASGSFAGSAKTQRAADGCISIKSPLVGVFYAAPAENAQPYAAIGTHVKKGQTLCIVEAMKLMNEVAAECDGVITEILAENGQLVEYGTELFRVRQDGGRSAEA